MTGGLRVRFDNAFDGVLWPGPLRAESAVFGEAWLGPVGLLGLLETQLGLGATHSSDSVRAASLIHRLAETEGYWSASLDADPHGTALRLLRDRDELFMDGWRGQPVSPRLGALADALSEVPPGLPERLGAILSELGNRDCDIESVELCAPRSELRLMWRNVLGALQQRGVRVVAPSKPQPDDAQVELLRPHGPLAAAQNVAAWLATTRPSHETVIIGGAAYLDRALIAHGLPSTGARGPADGLLAILPLVLELGWTPADPKIAHALLSIPGGPVPKRIARRLRRALDQWPAVGSKDWNERLASSLAEIEDEGRRDRTALRLGALFDPVADHGEPYPLGAVVERTALVAAWASQRAQFEEEPGSYYRVQSQCQLLLRLLEAAKPDPMSSASLSRWVQIATSEISSSPPFIARVGSDVRVGRVSRPDAVAGPVDTVVWWGFERRSAALPAPVSLSHDERAALAESGVALRDPGAVALSQAHRWRRPLAHARRVVLVCPHRGEDGSALYPHPLWDELCVDRSPPTLRVLEAATVETKLAPLPQPVREVRLPAGRTYRRAQESPSSLGALVGCSFQWVLKYFGQLRSGLAQPIPDISPLIFGKLAHQLFERMLAQDPLPDDPGPFVDAFFDGDARLLAAPLFLPGNEHVRADIATRLRASARVLLEHIRTTGSRVERVEETLERPFLDGVIGGRPDLVLADPDLLIDHKWGNRADRGAELANGTAFQLAAYAQLVGRHVPVTFFIVRSHELLEANDAIDITWGALEAACHARYAELDAGHAEVAMDDRRRATIDDDTLTLPAPCTYCDFSVLCGKAFSS